MRVKRLAVLALLVAVTRSVPADELKPFPEESPAPDPSSTDSQPQPEEWKPALWVTFSTNVTEAYVLGEKEVRTPVPVRRTMAVKGSDGKIEERQVTEVSYKSMQVADVLPVGIYAVCDAATISASPDGDNATRYTFDSRGPVTILFHEMRCKCESAIFDGEVLSMKGVRIQYRGKIMSSESMTLPLDVVSVQTKPFRKPESEFQLTAILSWLKSDAGTQSRSPQRDRGFQRADDWNPQRPKDKGDQGRDTLDRGRTRDVEDRDLRDFQPRSDRGQ